MNNPNDNLDEKLIKNIRRVLDQSLEQLDPGSLAAVGQLKYHALKRLPRRRIGFATWGTVAATVVAAALVFLLYPVSQEFGAGLVESDNDFQLLLTEDAIEFYSEDLEFYEWLSDVLDHDPELIHYRDDVSTDPAAGRIGGAKRAAAQYGSAGIFGVFRG